MDSHLEKLPSMVDAIRAIKEIIITNIVLIGQIPSPTFKEEKRTRIFMERLAEAQVDECTTDAYGNPIGIVKGTSEANPPIFVVAHLDTFFGEDVDHNFTVKKKTISGPGILDNSAGVGVLASLPEIMRTLGIGFKSDIVLVGDIQSIGKGNLRGIRNLLKTWPTPIRGAVCIEGGELGRLNYYSDGMRRCEITCSIPSTFRWTHKFRPNAILILHEVINQILKMRLPQKPRARVIIGKIAGGVDYGEIAQDAILGFEIQSDTDKMVKAIYRDIKDIKNGISHEHEVELQLRTVSSLNAARLRFNHPLVKSAAEVLKKLELKPVSVSSETELSIFLFHKIPAVTIGITKGENYHLENAVIKIAPIYKGIAQLIGILMAIDSGVCDEQ
ncbi:MAG: M20/M25/M40 family metallo-hydrolase [Desulfobacterales bacterium]|nr:M20/M25/M40 family metallo-hydrolase [Desulfobacterales bacterium]